MPNQILVLASRRFRVFSSFERAMLGASGRAVSLRDTARGGVRGDRPQHIAQHVACCASLHVHSMSTTVDIGSSATSNTVVVHSLLCSQCVYVCLCVCVGVGVGVCVCVLSLIPI